MGCSVCLLRDLRVLRGEIPENVGWVERSTTHHLLLGISKCSLLKLLRK